MKYFVICILLASIAIAASKNVSSRVANGIPSYSNDFVYLEVRFIEISRICGSCLINKQWVVTTASCVTDPTENSATVIYAMLGNTYLVKPDTPTAILTIPHPNYDSKSATSPNDIAMLKLSTVVVNTVAVSVIASLETNIDFKYLSKSFVVCGYGFTDNKKTKPVTLTCGTLYGINPTECAVTNNELCLTSNSESGGPCGRDNGAPLYRINSDYSRVLVGLFTRTIGSSSKSMCIDGHSKYVFTNVAAFDAFITNSISQNLN